MNQLLLDNIHEAAKVLRDTIEQYTQGRVVVLWGVAHDKESVEGITLSEDLQYAELTKLMFGLNGRAYTMITYDE